MKRLFIVISLFILFLLPFSCSFAHGGVQNSAGNVTATFFISPLLPTVGEESTISFNLTDKETGKRLANYPAQMRIKETEDDNEDHDKVLLKRDIKSDVNGAIQANFKFPTNKIYDIELEFPSVKDTDNEVGFLVQPQQKPSNTIPYTLIVIAFLAGLAGGYKLNFFKTNS